MDKIKPLLKGEAETMLQSFYARAQYSKKKNRKFYDAKAVEIVDQLDYNFSKASKGSVMSSGVIARTIVFDELVSKFIMDHPDCTIVNIACGLDTRIYRLDNGKITWINLDLPETIEIRDSIYHESGRISSLGKSVLDPSWPQDIDKKGCMLFIVEGLSIYFTHDEVKTMLTIIRDHFDDATIMMECLSPMWVKKTGVEKSIESTGASFKWGCKLL